MANVLALDAQVTTRWPRNDRHVLADQETRESLRCGSRRQRVPPNPVWSHPVSCPVFFWRGLEMAAGLLRELEVLPNHRGSHPLVSSFQYRSSLRRGVVWLHAAVKRHLGELHRLRMGPTSEMSRSTTRRPCAIRLAVPHQNGWGRLLLTDKGVQHPW